MGRDHEYDDNGLPPADDLVVPDDARELDREIQAYHRELRWHRRRERWHALFTLSPRHGPTTVLLAGVVLLAAMSAALLMLSTRPDTEGFRSSSGVSPATGAQGTIGAPLVDTRARVNGHPRDPSALHPAVLALVPTDCDCRDALASLTGSAHQYGIPVYLVESGPRAPELEQLAGRLGEDQHPPVLEEPAGKIAQAYGSAGLDAVLVSHDGRVSTVLDQQALRSEAKLETHLAPLRGAWESGNTSPGSSPGA